MALINAESLTLNPREAETVSEVIFKRIYNDSDLAEYHEMETGIDVKAQIAFAGRLGLLGKKTTGCTPNEAGGFELTEKYWTPILEDFRLKHCQADMPALLKLFRKSQRINPDFFDAVGTQEFGVIISAVEVAMLENMHRKIWFNDTTAKTIADNGNVGIGITSPAYKLDVNGNMNAQRLNLGNGDNLTWGGDYSSGHSTIAATDSSIGFYPGGGLEKVHFSANGNVGIGTATPTYKLDVSGTGKFSGEVIVPNGTSSSSAVNKGQLDIIATQLIVLGETLAFKSDFVINEDYTGSSAWFDNLNILYPDKPKGFIVYAIHSSGSTGVGAICTKVKGGGSGVGKWLITASSGVITPAL